MSKAEAHPGPVKPIKIFISSPRRSPKKTPNSKPMALTLPRHLLPWRIPNPLLLLSHFLNPRTPLLPSSYSSPNTLIRQSRTLISRLSPSGFSPLPSSPGFSTVLVLKVLIFFSHPFVSVDKTLVLTEDERSASSKSEEDKASPESATIAAIVTALGGGAAPVGIVRLSGPTAVAVARRVFRPARSSARGPRGVSWKPKSHFVEYGFALDQKGNVIDEVSSC